MDKAEIAKDRADWLVDAVATATQNRRFLRGDPAANDVEIEAIQLNGEKAIQTAIETYCRSTDARAMIRDGQIVISIDIDALPLILSGSIAAGDLMSGYCYKVTDPAVFAREVCRSLNEENEIGTTDIHKMFDRAMMHAIDWGGEGVEEVDEDGFEAEAARLQEEARRGQG